MKILIPVDGSGSANRAVEQVIKMASQLKEMPQIYLLNVQWNIASGNIKLFINQQTIEEYYREQGLAALATAREKLDAVNMAYSYHVSVGVPAEGIVQYAMEQQVDQIVMGAGERRNLASFLLGSVVNKILHLVSIPVLLVK